MIPDSIPRTTDLNARITDTDLDVDDPPDESTPDAASRQSVAEAIAANVHYKGAYNGASSYIIGDIISVGFGTSLGFYIAPVAIAAGSNALPYSATGPGVPYRPVDNIKGRSNLRLHIALIGATGTPLALKSTSQLPIRTMQQGMA